MSKIITFSRTFPAFHPRAGENTYFIEQIYNSIYADKSGDWSDAPGSGSNYLIELDTTIDGRKHHTIRCGSRFVVGEKFSPRVWSSAPYRSKQIIIAPDIEVKKVYDIIVRNRLNESGERLFQVIVNGKIFNTKREYEKLSKNDGLSEVDFLNWFYTPRHEVFSGQIICWRDVNY